MVGRVFGVISEVGNYIPKVKARDEYCALGQSNPINLETDDIARRLEESERRSSAKSIWRLAHDRYYTSLYTTMITRLAQDQSSTSFHTTTSKSSAAQATYRTGELLTDAFWKTLVCSGEYVVMRRLYPDSRRGKVLEQFYEPPTRMGHQLLGVLEIEGFDPPDKLQVAPAIGLRDTVSEGRNWCITDNGYMGWVPFCSQPGDKVTVIEGQDTPFVIRPVGGVYRLIGECYIHGVMGGQIMEDYTGKCLPQVIYLV